MTNNDNIILTWVLTDGRAGSDKQSQALSSILEDIYNNDKRLGAKVKVVEKFIDYNPISSLPNVIIGKTLLGIKKRSRKILQQDTLPDVVISASRRLAPVACWVKKQKPSVKLVHIMRPQMPAKFFDALLIPKHDKFDISSSNILRIDGAIAQINKVDAKLEADKLQTKLDSLQPPYIGVFMGGDHASGKFTDSAAKDLASILNNIAEKFNASLLVSTSRRTGHQNTEIIKKGLSAPHYFYDYNSGQENPYMAFLGLADVLVSSADSISTISELISSGKSIYIYSDKNLLGKKHEAFLQELYNEGVVYNLVELLGDHARLGSKSSSSGAANTRIAKFLSKVLKED